MGSKHSVLELYQVLMFRPTKKESKLLKKLVVVNGPAEIEIFDKSPRVSLPAQGRGLLLSPGDCIGSSLCFNRNEFDNLVPQDVHTKNARNK